METTTIIVLVALVALVAAVATLIVDRLIRRHRRRVQQARCHRFVRTGGIYRKKRPKENVTLPNIIFNPPRTSTPNLTFDPPRTSTRREVSLMEVEEEKKEEVVIFV